MTTTLQTIRNLFPRQEIKKLFPEKVRARGVKMLIGPSCLTLSMAERQAIGDCRNDRSAFARWEGDHFREVNDRVSQETLRSYRMAQRIYWTSIGSGVVTGAATGGAVGFRINPASPIVIAGGALVGGVMGGYSGHLAGDAIGAKLTGGARRRVIEDFTHSPAVKQWKEEKLVTVVFPALGQFVPLGDFVGFRAGAPFKDPVRAEDGHVYERREILQWLDNWEKDHPEKALAALNEEKRREAEISTSPFRVRLIDKGHLTPEQRYYPRLFRNACLGYNERIRMHGEIFAAEREGHRDQFLEERKISKQEGKNVVRFYSTPERERLGFAFQMLGRIIESEKIPAQEATSFLTSLASNPVQIEL